MDGGKDTGTLVPANGVNLTRVDLQGIETVEKIDLSNGNHRPTLTTVLVKSIFGGTQLTIDGEYDDMVELARFTKSGAAGDYDINTARNFGGNTLAVKVKQGVIR
ncbi:MAG: hypothetical protein V6Z86_02095 [Hyphomicrobiales bacterium]